MENKQEWIAVGKEIKRIRLKAGATQADISQAMGYLTSQYVSNIERGCCAASPQLLKLMCEKFGGSKKRLASIHLKHYMDAFRKEIGL